MLLLHGHEPLSTAASLQQRLTAGLGEFFHLTRGHEHVTVRGELEALEFLGIDLSFVHANLAATPPLPGPMQDTERDIPLRHLEFNAAPVFLAEQAQFTMHLQATALRLGVLRDARHHRWLALLRAGEGRAVVDLAEGQLDRLLLGGLRQAAARHKFTVDKGTILLEQLGPATMQMQIVIHARKAFLKGAIEVSGRLLLDPQLNIRPAQLACEGHGLLGKAAVPFMKPQLEQWEARPFPLLGHTFGEIACRQPRITLGPGNALHVEAEFGSP